MFKKRGQLTLFIIIAIVLVIVIILYFYLNSNFLKVERYDEKVEVLRQEILSCYEKSFEEALIMVGIQGGYLEVPEPKYHLEDHFLSFDIPYYYYEKELYAPSLEKIKNEIKKISELATNYCNLEYKSKEGFDFIEFRENEVTLKINEKDITFTPKITLTVTYQEKTIYIDFSKKPIKIDSELHNMHKIATFIAENYKNNNEWTPFSEITQMSKEFDLYVNIEDSTSGEENTVEILKMNPEIYPKIFIFNNKFSHKNLNEIEPLLQ